MYQKAAAIIKFEKDFLFNHNLHTDSETSADYARFIGTCNDVHNDDKKL